MIVQTHEYILLTLMITCLSLETSYQKIQKTVKRESKGLSQTTLKNSQDFILNSTLNLNYGFKVMNHFLMFRRSLKCLESIGLKCILLKDSNGKNDEKEWRHYPFKKTKTGKMTKKGGGMKPWQTEWHGGSIL